MKDCERKNNKKVGGLQLGIGSTSESEPAVCGTTLNSSFSVVPYVLNNNLDSGLLILTLIGTYTVLCTACTEYTMYTMQYITCYILLLHD